MTPRAIYSPPRAIGSLAAPPRTRASRSHVMWHARAGPWHPQRRARAHAQTDQTDMHTQAASTAAGRSPTFFGPLRGATRTRPATARKIRGEAAKPEHEIREHIARTHARVHKHTHASNRDAHPCCKHSCRQETPHFSGRCVGLLVLGGLLLGLFLGGLLLGLFLGLSACKRRSTRDGEYSDGDTVRSR